MGWEGVHPAFAAATILAVFLFGILPMLISGWREDRLAKWFRRNHGLLADLARKASRERAARRDDYLGMWEPIIGLFSVDSDFVVVRLDCHNHNSDELYSGALEGEFVYEGDPPVMLEDLDPLGREPIFFSLRTGQRYHRC